MALDAQKHAFNYRRNLEWVRISYISGFKLQSSDRYLAFRAVL